MRLGLLLGVCVGLGGVSLPALAAGPTPVPVSAKVEIPETLDLATDFLETVAKAPSGQDFAKAWLAYEERHWEFYREAFYPGDRAAAKRQAWADELSSRRVEVVDNVRRFMKVGPQAVSAARHKVAKLTGVMPNAGLCYVVALNKSNAFQRELFGAPKVVLNTWHETFVDSSLLEPMMAHEFIHNVHALRFRSEAEAATSVACRLWTEGGALFSTHVLYPHLDEPAILTLSPAEIEQARKAVPLVAANLRGLLHNEGTEQDEARFFKGSYKDSVLPARSGYYMGLKIFQRVAAEKGVEAALRMGPAEFVTEADHVLTEWAKEQAKR